MLFVNQPGTTSYSQVELPANGSLELVFEVNETSSTGIVYVSLSLSHPGPALHDAMFEVPLVSGERGLKLCKRI